MEHVPVVIIGSGPSGLLLGHLLAKAGIDTLILERQTRDYVEARIRAGVLEQGAVDLMTEAGVADRLHAQGLVHDGIEIAFRGVRRRVDFRDLTGKSVVVYGQTEITRDMIDRRDHLGLTTVWSAEDVTIEGIDGDRPVVRWREAGVDKAVSCAFVAGCDGFHGVSRKTVADRITAYERVYPFGWLGILAECPPPADELIYARHARGFALYSMRSRSLSRHYIQCRPDEDLAQWSDDRVWEELRLRLDDPEGRILKEGRVIEKSVTPMRSFVAGPMRHGRLFLVGDAAHIVPPTGAKGLNLAASDVKYLSDALIAQFRTGAEDGLAAYSDKAQARIWKAQRFSWWMTSILHPAPTLDAFEDRAREAELDYVLSSRAALTSLAENYVGLPY